MRAGKPDDLPSGSRNRRVQRRVKLPGHRLVLGRHAARDADRRCRSSPRRNIEALRRSRWTTVALVIATQRKSGHRAATCSTRYGHRSPCPWCSPASVNGRLLLDGAFPETLCRSRQPCRTRPRPCLVGLPAYRKRLGGGSRHGIRKPPARHRYQEKDRRVHRSVAVDAGPGTTVRQRRPQPDLYRYRTAVTRCDARPVSRALHAGCLTRRSADRDTDQHLWCIYSSTAPPT